MAFFSATCSGILFSVISTAAPGSKTLTITNPIPTAIPVVTIKNVSVINPVFPTFLISPKPEIPTIIEEIINGTTSIFKESRNISPNQPTDSIFLPKTQPQNIPKRIPTIIK